MHNFSIGDAFNVICDHWVPDGPGAERNAGRAVRGGKVVSDEYVAPERPGMSGKDVVTLDDGRRFERYDCYVAFSPYGWEEVSA